MIKDDLYILSQSPLVANSIHQSLAAFNVNCVLFTSLKEIWPALLKGKCLLCVVDVSSMSEGELNLKNHPSVKAEDIPLAFFVPEGKKPLAISVQNFWHQGITFQGMDLAREFSEIIKRAKKIRSMQGQLKAQTREGVFLQDHLEKNMIGVEELRAREDYHKKLLATFTLMEQEKKASDFFSAMSNIFGADRDISQFAYYEIAPSDRKLISPTQGGNKYRRLPSLLIEESSSNGINPVVQNSANQVALEVFGIDFVTLLVKGTKANPDVMIFISSNIQRYLEQFPWKSLEKYLSGFYLNFKVANVSDNPMLSPWNMAQLISQTFSGNKTAHQQYVQIYFGKLLGVIGEVGNNQFRWHEFYQDFTFKMERVLSFKYHLSNYGLENVIMAIDDDNASAFLEIRDFCQRYPYWRYFNKSEAVMSRALSPEVRILSPGIEALMNTLEGPQGMVPVHAL
jgi:hypothetical protein